MDIIFKKSHNKFLIKYIALYQVCFPNAKHLNLKYLNWLYSDNPAGSLVGVDAYYGDEVIGQVTAIPGEYFLSGRLVKGLLAVNVAVHPRFQGRYLFKKLGLKMCEYASEEGYEFVIGVANKAATPGWVRQMGFQLVQPLEARLGLINLNININIIRSAEQFRHVWSERALAWRLSNPNNPIFTHANKDVLQCYAAVKGKLLSVYAELPESFLVEKSFKYACFFSPVRLFLGLIPHGSCDFTGYIKIPQQLRPSPLNLIYRSLNQRVEKLEKEHISFSFLDFDAY